jgi:ubiquinone/menaquinone biosynthesis C-methylase UbiE
MTGEEFSLVDVFRDAKKHREIAGIIAKYLQNKVDIRRVALDGIDLMESKSILDIGCGFGFFTEALKDRVHHDAKVTGIDRYPEYEWFFFQSCEKAGIKADFRSNGIELIRELDDNSYDLILCSYALYFFPDVIKDIARILRSDGFFIAITHALPHMKEFTSYVRSILRNNGMIINIDLPYETLISRFSNINGQEALQPYFKEIITKDYKAKLCFGANDYKDLVKYFNFKHSFFIPDSMDPDDEFHKKVTSSIEADLNESKGLEITKNDIIFVCTAPEAINPDD